VLQQCLDVSRKESDLFQKDVNPKEKYEGEQKTVNVNSMKLGDGKDFPYDTNLEGIIVEGHELFSCWSWLHLKTQPSG